MGELLVVKGDRVDGTDTHAVSGPAIPPPTATYTGTADYEYKGAVTAGLSDLVTVGGKPLAVVTSGSTLREDGKAAHAASAGSNFTPPGPAPDLKELAFVPPTEVGAGKPSQGAGSALLTVGGAAALLDGDPFDTCGIPGGEKSSTVAASGQDFVTCSA